MWSECRVEKENIRYLLNSIIRYVTFYKHWPYILCACAHFAQHILPYGPLKYSLCFIAFAVLWSLSISVLFGRSHNGPILTFTIDWERKRQRQCVCRTFSSHYIAYFFRFFELEIQISFILGGMLVVPLFLLLLCRYFSLPHLWCAMCAFAWQLIQ